MSERQESRVTETASWLCLAASFILSFATWIALGDNAGYGVVLGIPLSIALAVCVDTYIVTALMTWLQSPDPHVRAFAQRNAYTAAILSVIAQAAYHGSLAADRTHDVLLTVLAIGAGMAPPGFAALAVHMRVRARMALTTATTATTTMPSTPPPVEHSTTTHPPELPVQTHPPAPTETPALPPPPARTVLPPQRVYRTPQPMQSPERSASLTSVNADRADSDGHDRRGANNARYKKVTPEVKERIRTLLDSGLTVQRVAYQVGYGTTTVQNIRSEMMKERKEGAVA